MSVDWHTLESEHERINASIINVMKAGIPMQGLDEFVSLNIIYANNAFDMYSTKLIDRDVYIKRMEKTKLRMMEAYAVIKSLDRTPCKKELLYIFGPFYKQLITCAYKHDEESCTNAGKTKPNRARAECTQPLKQPSITKRSEGPFTTTASDKKLLEKWNGRVIMNMNKCKLAYENKKNNSINDDRYLQELSEARDVMDGVFREYKSMVGRYSELTIDMKQFESYFLPFYSALLNCPTIRSQCDLAHEAKIPFLRQNQLS